jgi:isopenicillin N synthase-like dioxygenase
MQNIPVIDLSGFATGKGARDREVAAAVDAACQEVGFLLISGHGVPDRLLHQMHDASKAFFTLPKELKRALQFANDDDIGYKSLGKSYLTNSWDSNANTGPAPDWKETFGARPYAAPANLSREEQPYFSLEIWPPSLPEMKAIYTEYFAQMTRLANALMGACALALGQEQTYFQDKIERQLSALAVQYYPEQLTPPEPGQIRAGAHTDFGSITILHTGDNPRGLQVWHRGGWVDVVPEWDQFVVNIGDLLAQWSNDRWVSTLHRVLNPDPERAQLARQSITFFHTPNWHTRVECLPNCSGPGNPPKYGPVFAGAYLEGKMARLRDLSSK